MKPIPFYTPGGEIEKNTLIKTNYTSCYKPPRSKSAEEVDSDGGSNMLYNGVVVQ